LWLEVSDCLYLIDSVRASVNCAGAATVGRRTRGEGPHDAVCRPFPRSCPWVGPAGTFGDLAVISDDGRHVYATFDAGAGGMGGVAVIDVRTRKVVDRWDYPGTGRPHGVWYSKKKLRD
jgi:hypothetical protein